MSINLDVLSILVHSERVKVSDYRVDSKLKANTNYISLFAIQPMTNINSYEYRIFNIHLQKNKSIWDTRKKKRYYSLTLNYSK